MTTEYRIDYKDLKKPSSRQPSLEQMRSKLVTPGLRPARKAKKVSAKSFFVWTGFGLAIVAGVILNAAHMTKASLGVATFDVISSKVQALKPPHTAWDTNKKALYYAYALYDFQKLHDEFRVGPNTIIDSHIARAELNRLIPQVDIATTRQLSMYMGGGRGP